MEETRQLDNNALPVVMQKDNRGGAGRGQGRKPTKAYKSLSEGALEYIERILIDNFGDSWKATVNEKKRMADALADIMEDLDIMDFDSPYLALLGGMVLYTFGKDRVKPKTFGQKCWGGIKLLYKKYKK